MHGRGRRQWKTSWIYLLLLLAVFFFGGLQILHFHQGHGELAWHPGELGAVVVDVNEETHPAEVLVANEAPVFLAESPVAWVAEMWSTPVPERQLADDTLPAEGPLELFADGEPSPGASLDGGVEAAEPAEVEEERCSDVHPNADSPDMLHVVYASDGAQVEGVRASVASVVTTTSAPDELTVHILVQEQSARKFKEQFGIREECQGIVTITGVLIRIHVIDGLLISRARANVPSKVRKERGAIDSMENFARFYMHLVLDCEIAIYLDADTIVQADLAILRKTLLTSKRTIGFVQREIPVKMDKFLRVPKKCGNDAFDPKWRQWKKLMAKDAYNVGVFAINLKRWRDLRIVATVEDFVAKHNSCNGGLWVGGSQPPLLLAFLSLPPGGTKDFIVFEAAWNAGDLGWREKMSIKKLKAKFVLHWNGARKPWDESGLYKELWQPHHDAFNSLLKAYKSDDFGSGQQQDGVQQQAGQDAHDSSHEPQNVRESPPKKPAAVALPAVSTTLSPEELAAHQACPEVEVLAEWTHEKAVKKCQIGMTYGCASGSTGVWTKDGCAAVFSVSGKVTSCSSAAAGGEQTCSAGQLARANPPCGMMILTTFFTTKKDWQRGKKTRPSFKKVSTLYKTVLQHGFNVTVVYDELPSEMIERYTCDQFKFHKVRMADHDSRYGVNDVRYFFFRELVESQREWKYIFIVDAFDVRLGMNPCSQLRPNTLFVGVEQDRLKHHPWMKARYVKMGGKYQQWYKRLDKTIRILNCGITGGSRDIMLKLLTRMTQVLEDPQLAVRAKTEDINLNMAVLNYVVYNEFEFKSGPPVHSAYKRYQNMRNDVWFIHK